MTIALVLAVRFTSWGLAMRAMSENADSARLSGVWIRRTSTVTWTVAGALSAFTAILNAPNQTSALTQALSPDLLLFALTAALIGAMVNLTVAFIAGVGMGVFLEVLEWNIPSPAKQQLILFIVVMVVLLVRVGALRKGVRTGDRSTWGHGAVTTLRAMGTACVSGSRSSGIWLCVLVAALMPLVLSVGNDVLFSQICIYAVIALSLTMLTGWAGQVSLGQFGLVAVGVLVAVHLGTSVPLILVMLYGGLVTAVVAILVGLPALRMPGLFLAVTTLGLRDLHAERGDGYALHHGPRHQQDALHRAAQPRVHLRRPTQAVRSQPGLPALFRLVLPGRAAGVDLHRAHLA